MALNDLCALAPAEPLAAAVIRLSQLPAGTRLRVAINGGKLTLTAPGMAPVVLSLLDDDDELVVDGQLGAQMAEVAESLLAAHAESDPLPTDPWFWVAASLLAAGNGGVQ